MAWTLDPRFAIHPAVTAPALTRENTLRFFNAVTSALFIFICSAASAYAGKLAIVIDDFGYRPQEENKILQMPLAISVAVLPTAPHAREMATKAHAQGREILIHLPMAPISKQPLEKDTLQPSMSKAEIQRIIHQAVNSVPYAVGMNNHMGSLMTSNLQGMQKVMRTLEQYHFLYFLDSMTIGNSQVTNASAGTGIKVIKRRVFLDDSQNEASIRQQFNRAIQIARKNGSAIAIGHPHPSTVRVLQQMLPSLPADIVLVRPSSLLNGASVPDKNPAPTQQKPRNPFRGVKQCITKKAPEKVYATAMFDAISSSLANSAPIKFIQDRWQYWH